ncbi:hypothetical protein [Haladaptatus sp. ZSTT2]|uniref:hypothetical protein n=1 Tax=Haladaptatus sp. ZSTT2 TaxID=3120515 RepID=UPI00300F62AB
MDIEGLQAVLEYATACLGEKLRAVGYATEAEITYTFMREDVSELYDELALSRIRDELVLSTLEQRHHEGLYAVGSLKATVRVFEQAVMVIFDDLVEYGAVILSFDTDAECSFVEFLSTCRSHLEAAESH